AAAVLLLEAATAGAQSLSFLPLLPPRQADAQDLLYLADQRPVRIRLHISINGRPFQQPWEDFLAQLFTYADRNGDKVLSKEEVERIPQPQLILNMLQGGIPFFQANAHAPFAQLDANKDGKVTLAELKAYFRRSGFAPTQMQGDPEQG